MKYWREGSHSGLVRSPGKTVCQKWHRGFKSLPLRIMYWIIFILGMLTSSIFLYFFAGKYEGDKIERSIRPKIGMYRIHIHHWIWSSVVFIFCIIFEFYHLFILGILIGFILQGLMYRDRFIIFYKDEDFEKIYSKYKLDK